MSKSTTREVAWIGLDISKSEISNAFLPKVGKARTGIVKNGQSGFRQLEKWALSAVPGGSEIRFCMESTGDYGVSCAMWLTERGYHVSVVNPAYVKYYARGKGFQNKTDKADAKVIAGYAKENSPRPWSFADPATRELFRLHRRLEQLMRTGVMEHNRRECPEAIGRECVQSIKRLEKLVREEAAQVQIRIDAIIDSDPELSRQVRLITSIPVRPRAQPSEYLRRCLATTRRWTGRIG